MCLSTAYAVSGNTQTKICEYICKIEVKDGFVKLTDVMGEEREIKGTVSSCDFVNNRVTITE